MCSPPGDDAVGREVLGRGVGEQRVLDEGPGIEQQVEAVADEELALLLELVADLGQVAGEGPFGRPREVVGVGEVGVVGHVGEPTDRSSPNPRTPSGSV